MMVRPVAISVCLLCATTVWAADWPQWRGIHRDGVSTETVPIWSEAPKAIWQRPMGEAHSSPVVAGGRVYAMEKAGTDEVVLCLDALTGKEVWKSQYHAPFSNVYGNGPRSTPCVTDGIVVTLGARGDLSAFEAGTGKVLWRVNLLEKFAATNLFFGTSCSPLVHEGMVLVMAGGKGAGVVALDLATGETRWTSQDDRASYASPILFRSATGPQAVVLTQKGLLALRPSDGTELWRWPLETFNDENSVTPVAFEDLVIGTSVSYGGVAMQVEGDKARRAWQTDAFSSYFSTPVVVGKELYAVTGTPATLKCLDARTGKERWKHGPVGLLHASMILADTRLLLQCDTGLLLLVEPDASGYKLLAKAQVSGPTWVHPALSDARLYVRDAKALKCLTFGGD